MPCALRAGPGPALFASTARGVGQLICAAIPSGIPAPFPLMPLAFSSSRRASHVSGDSPELGLDAAGVGQADAPPDDEEPAPPVRCPQVFSAQIDHRPGIARSLQLEQHPVEASIAEARHVLNEDPTRSKSDNDIVHAPPEA